MLVAISGLSQAAIAFYLKRETAQQVITQTREAGFPENCPNCGGPIDVTKVKWTGTNTATCPYCGAIIKTAKVTIPVEQVNRG